jgi:hypothetical protein
VLKPGGSLLIANLTGFTSACADQGWVKDEEGRRLHFPSIAISMNFHFSWNGLISDRELAPAAIRLYGGFLESGLN